MLLTSIALLLSLSNGSSLVQTPGYRSDDRLTKPCDLRLKIVPVGEALKAISKQTDVPLELTTVVKDLKCTILVKQRSAKQVMERLADVLRCDWQTAGSGYRLFVPNDLQSSEKLYVAAEDRLLRQSTEKTLSQLALISEVPFDKIKDRLTELWKLWSENRNDPAKLKKIDDEREALSRALNGTDYIQAKIFAQFDKEQWRRFWQGEVFYGSTAAKGTAIRLPQELLTIRLPFFQSVEGRFDRMQAFIQFDPTYSQIRKRLNLFYGGSDNPTSVMSSPGMISLAFPEPTLAGLMFSKEIVAWNTWETSSAPELNLKIENPRSGAPSTYWSAYYSDADHLEWLFDQTGVPIVAYATRTPNHRSQLKTEAKTLKDYLKVFIDQDHAYFRIADGFLMHRRGSFWRLRLAEVPEAVLGSLEDGHRVSLNDYAWLASQLSPLQASCLGSPSSYLLKFSGYPIADAYPALKFYASLPASQRQQCLSGTPLAYASLSGPGRKLFESAIVQGVLGSGGMNGSSNKIFDQAFDLDMIGTWSFQIVTQGINAMTRSRISPLDAPVDAPSLGNMPESPGIKFVFGPNPETGLTYLSAWPDAPKR